jgi:N6-L-threonylcarbamoyladenine synthase
LIKVEGFGKYKILGRTRDDAVGEVFDKIAKFLNLGYPGGPLIDKFAKKGNTKKINFPRPHLPGSWDFSFSGLKTAVINYVREHRSIRTCLTGPLRQSSSEASRQERLYDLCASFQQSCVDVLVAKTVLACKKFKVEKIALGGGVSANSRLRADFIKKCGIEDIKLFMPPPVFCTDNAAMVASAGYFKLKKTGAAARKKIIPSANLELENW